MNDDEKTAQDRWPRLWQQAGDTAEGERLWRRLLETDAQTQFATLGALVRLVRTIPYLYEHGAELPDHQERIAAWLAEARALVGEEEPNA